MPSYQVTAPDGRRYRVNAPEGATQEQALQYAQQNYQQRNSGQALATRNSGNTPAKPWKQVVASQEYQALSPDQQEAARQQYFAEVVAPQIGDPAQVQQARMQFDAQTKVDRAGGASRLQQIEAALRAADAAGNTNDARRLAQAYAAERDAPQPSRGALLQEAERRGLPISDRDQALMAEARKRGLMLKGPIQVQGTEQRPTSNYSEDQLFAKLEKADAAGDTEAAHVIADEIRRIRGQQGNAPQATAKAAPARANFGNVRSNATSVPGRRDTYTGPLLAPSSMASAAPQAPTLADTNASNRAYQASPQAAIDRQRYAASQAEAKRRDFQSLPAPMRAAIGAGSRVAAAGRGVGQMYAAAADAVDPRAPTLGGLVTGQDPSRYGQAMQGEAAARADQQYLQGDTAATIGGFAGDLGLLAAPGGAVGRTRGLAALLGNAGLGAGYAGLQPVVQGESRAANTVVGGAFGAAGHGVASGVSALGRNASQAIPSEVRQMAQRANALGIPLHASQVSQSLPVKVAASAGKYLPFSGYGKAASRQQEGVNRAVAKTFGADAPKLTDDVMQQARQRLSKQFEDIYNRNAVPITERGARKLAEVEREASRRLTNDEAQVLRNQLDDILGNADDGVLTGQKYQAVRTALRKAEGNDKLGLAVRELRQGLDDIAADAVGPNDSAALKALRSQWANFRTVESALKQVSGAGGDVRLASLWPLIRKGSTKEMRDLARMGQVLLKDPIADSGTAQRTFAYNLLMGGGSIANPALIPLIAKAAAGGATIGRAANSNSLARLLTRESRGAPTSRLGALMQRGTPYAAPAAAVHYNNGGGR